MKSGSLLLCFEDLGYVGGLTPKADPSTSAAAVVIDSILRLFEFTDSTGKPLRV
jgi:hypothetical protein